MTARITPVETSEVCRLAALRHDLFVMNSKYARWYFQIVTRAVALDRRKRRTHDKDYVLYERHHIIPKAMGGENGYRNTVLLTPQEHMICHLCLPKMCALGEHRLLMEIAIARLQGNNARKLSTGMYALSKQALARANTARFGGVPKTAAHNEKNRQAHMGERNPFFGRTHTDETKARIAASSSLRRGQRHTPEAIAKIRMAMRGKGRPRRAYVVISPIGERFIVNNLRSFCSRNGLNTQDMRNTSYGALGTHRNWRALPLNPFSPMLSTAQRD